MHFSPALFPSSALFVLGVLSGACVGGDSVLETSVKGDASQMSTVEGQYPGYQVKACPNSDTRWLVIGSGSEYYDRVGPDDSNRQFAIEALRDEVLAPIYSEFESQVSSSAFGMACGLEVSPIPTISISNWAEIDSLIDEVGSAIQTHNLREIVQLSIEPSF